MQERRSANLEEACQVTLCKLLQLCHLSSLAVEDECVIINLLPLTCCQLKKLLGLFQLGLDKLLHLSSIMALLQLCRALRLGAKQGLKLKEKLAGTYGVLAWDANSSCGMASSSAAAELTKASTRLSRCSALKAADWMMKATLRTVSTLQDDSHTYAAERPS